MTLGENTQVAEKVGKGEIKTPVEVLQKRIPELTLKLQDLLAEYIKILSNQDTTSRDKRSSLSVQIKQDRNILVKYVKEASNLSEAQVSLQTLSSAQNICRDTEWIAQLAY